ncbi:hypothetical protein Asi03nite_26220 [Actinoplanes siamensis]|uniref:Uncharacterized protein n=1 Tax=Actinoplanes siamensis TaxID=1223317 RepID=A0A919N691_9ACTN|nr:hypothetical protein Asi03nite_26220 [Actinoplanes siamensis]
MAASWDNYWPPLGRIDWPLTTPAGTLQEYVHQGREYYGSLGLRSSGPSTRMSPDQLTAWLSRRQSPPKRCKLCEPALPGASAQHGSRYDRCSVTCPGRDGHDQIGRHGQGMHAVLADAGEVAQRSRGWCAVGVGDRTRASKPSHDACNVSSFIKPYLRNNWSSRFAVQRPLPRRGAR